MLEEWNHGLKPKTLLCTAILVAIKGVIPAKAGIQGNTGFRVKPGMTNYMKLMPPNIKRVLPNILPFHYSSFPALIFQYTS